MKRPWANSIRGSVVGPVVQAGAVHGDVYVNTQDAAHEADPLLIVTTTARQVYQHETRGGCTRGAGIEILVQTRSTQAVVLHGLRPAFIRRLPPERWLFRGLSSASAIQVRSMYIGLDRFTPQSHILDRLFTPQSHIPDGSGFPFKVTASDPEMFRVILGSVTVDAATLELTWTCADRSGKTTVDQDGEPFTLHSVYGVADPLTFDEVMQCFREDGMHEHADELQRRAEFSAHDHDDQPPQNTETAN